VLFEQTYYISFFIEEEVVLPVKDNVGGDEDYGDRRS
jgi:hypothetical protein